MFIFIITITDNVKIPINMNKNKILLQKLMKYQEKYQLVGSTVVQHSILHTSFKDEEIESLNEDNVYSVAMYLLKALKEEPFNDIEKEIFQDTWEFNQFKDFANIIKFFSLFEQNKINISQSQFKNFYDYNELASRKEEGHIEFYEYVKKNIPHIDADEVFKELLDEIRHEPVYKEKESYCLMWNRLSLRGVYNVNLLRWPIEKLIDSFCQNEGYSYYCDKGVKNNNFYYIFYGEKIDKKLINKMFDFIIGNYTSIIEIDDAEKSYINFKLETNLSFQKNQNLSKI